ncbi:MAG: CAP domain-containing protein [Planctomycetota bacterium]
MSSGICRAAAILSLALFLSCGKDENQSGTLSGGGVGASTPLLWNDTSGTGTGTTGDTPLQWNDPNTAATVLGYLDPTDIRTYTYPDIYILGNRHPLMTQIEARDFPVIITQENRLTEILIEWRISEYERALAPLRRTDPRFPRAAFLTEYPDLRRNARAHSKHYAVHHPTIPLPNGANFEGDDPTGRLAKSFITAEAIAQLVASGPNSWSPDQVANDWTTAARAMLLDPNWTHLGVGYWSSEGSVGTYYWTLLLARNPRVLFTGPEVTIILF